MDRGMKAGKFSKISCGADAGAPGNIQANQQPILIRRGFKCSKASASGRREYRRGTLPGTADASAGSITLEASVIAIHGWKQKNYRITGPYWHRFFFQDGSDGPRRLFFRDSSVNKRTPSVQFPNGARRCQSYTHGSYSVIDLF
jgi:hypothetical protein